MIQFMIAPDQLATENQACDQSHQTLSLTRHSVYDGVAQLVEPSDSRFKDPRLEPRPRQEHKKKNVSFSE